MIQIKSMLVVLDLHNILVGNRFEEMICDDVAGDNYATESVDVFCTVTLS